MKLSGNKVLLLILSGILASCHTEEPETGNAGTEDEITIINNTFQINACLTKRGSSETTEFADGSTVSISVFTETADETSGTVYKDYGISNMSATMTAGRWISDKSLEYAGAGIKHRVIGIYPYGKAELSGSPGVIKWNIASGELMTAVSESIDPSVRTADLTFMHRTALVSITVSGGEETAIRGATISGCITSMTYDCFNDAASPDPASAQNITIAAAGGNISAALIPQTLSLAEAVSIAAERNGAPLTLSVEYDGSPLALTAGAVIELHLSVSDEQASVDDITVNGESVMEDKDAWDGVSISSSLEGSGTADDPYIISSPADIAFMRDRINENSSEYFDKTYRLEKDINLNNFEWVPISDDIETATCFKGTFDGNGRTIRNLRISSESRVAGLFGYIRGSITDLTIENAEISSDYSESGESYAGRQSARNHLL